MRNPMADPLKCLGITQADYDAARAAALAYLVAHADQAQVDEAAVIAVHARLADPRVWNTIKVELGIR